MPLISVIIPVYNSEETIHQTIESVLNQTFSDFELIIINDGSTDSTLEIVSNIPDSRLSIYSYPNSGVSITRNRGIQKAKGEYIAFIDADDLWTPDKLESQYLALQASPDSGVAYSWIDYISESGEVIPGGAKGSFNGDVFKSLLLADFVGTGSNPLIRASALAEIGNFDESINYSEDWDLWLRLAAHYSFVVVPQVSVLYRMRAGSLSKNFKGMATGSFKVLQKVFIEAPLPIQKLKRTCFANRYKSLARDILEQKKFSQSQSFLALQCLYYATVNDKSMIKYQVFWKALAKILIAAILPVEISSTLFSKNKIFLNFYALTLLRENDVNKII
jgi:glycosyltransferase involved in cell wall biosynthesis